jgi:hypothetical protein
MLLALAASAIWMTAPVTAEAHTFKWVNMEHPYKVPPGSRTRPPANVVYINMHTVSAFCRDVSWNGALKPGEWIYLSTSGVCLVDRVEARDSRGQTVRWSGAGRSGNAFFVYPGSQITVDPCNWGFC